MSNQQQDHPLANAKNETLPNAELDQNKRSSKRLAPTSSSSNESFLLKPFAFNPVKTEGEFFSISSN